MNKIILIGDLKICLLNIFILKKNIIFFKIEIFNFRYIILFINFYKYLNFIIYKFILLKFENLKYLLNYCFKLRQKTKLKVVRFYFLNINSKQEFKKFNDINIQNKYTDFIKIYKLNKYNNLGLKNKEDIELFKIIRTADIEDHPIFLHEIETFNLKKLGLNYIKLATVNLVNINGKK